MIKPKRLRRGDKVAVVSLSKGLLGEDFTRHNLDFGKKRLEDLGLEVIFMPHALKGIDYVAKHPEKRANDLIQAFEDDTIKGIICAIGGAYDDGTPAKSHLFDAFYNYRTGEHGVK